MPAAGNKRRERRRVYSRPPWRMRPEQCAVHARRAPSNHEQTARPLRQAQGRRGL